MIIKQFISDEDNNRVEILLSQNQDESYNVIKKQDNNQSAFQRIDDLEWALEIFDIFLKEVKK